MRSFLTRWLFLLLLIRYKQYRTLRRGGFRGLRLLMESVVVYEALVGGFNWLESHFAKLKERM